MKKHICAVIILLAFCIGNAQNSEEENVKQTIISFFDAFHKQDTVKLKSMAKGNIKMQSISGLIMLKHTTTWGLRSKINIS